MARRTAGRTEPERPRRASGIDPLHPLTGLEHARALSRAQLLELYYWMRMTRLLEERLVALYRQTKVVGGLFRSLGQEADAVGSTFALERRDIMSPLIRNMGSMLVKRAIRTDAHPGNLGCIAARRNPPGFPRQAVG